MKKRILSILMVAVLSLSTITGCGSNETTNDAAKESTQESVAEPTAEPTEAPTPEPTEAPTPEPTEAPTPEPTEVPTPEPTEVPSVEETAEPGTEVVVDSEWATAYEGYFERENILSENVYMAMNVSQDGLTFGLEMATAGDNTYMNIDFGIVALEMYADTENVYTCTVMEGQEVWNYAPITGEGDVDSVMSMGDAAIVDTSTFSSCEYYGEVTEEGIVYDILLAGIEEDGKVTDTYCYINRETQKLCRMVMETEAGPMAIEISEIDKVEIPAEALAGTEVTMDDIGETIVGVIMTGAFSAMEQ